MIGENIASEREFKLEVLEWLNNGQPKLFRSPSEGNYIVRLLNVSLAPNDTVGRMLHTFTATAYEIAEHNYANLSKYGLISVGDPTVKQLRWETIDLAKSGIGSNKNLLNYRAVSLYFEGMVPGDKLHINDGIIRYDDDGNATLGFDVIIGVTGSYIIDLDREMEIQSVVFKGSPDNTTGYLPEQSDTTKPADMGIVQHQGQLTYAYYSKVQNRFDSIKDVQITDTPLQQFIGIHTIIDNNTNASDEIQDAKVEVQEIYWIHAMLREICPAYYNDTGYYMNFDCTLPVSFDSYVVYYVYDKLLNNYFYLDGHTRLRYPIEEYSSIVYFNGNGMDLSETAEYSIKHPKNIQSIKSSLGTMVEISYQKQTVEYAVESNSNAYPELVNKKSEVDLAYNNLRVAIYEGGSEEEILRARIKYESLYEDYILMLEEALEAEEAAQGDIAI